MEETQRYIVSFTNSVKDRLILVKRFSINERADYYRVLKKLGCTNIKIKTLLCQEADLTINNSV